jgi:hypothetical protein
MRLVWAPVFRHNAHQPSTWRGRSEHISFDRVGCEAGKIPAAGEFFFLTSTFIELIRMWRSARWRLLLFYCCLSSAIVWLIKIDASRYISSELPCAGEGSL